ncbi:MAG TPA: hypothetical protein VJY34_16065 [Roseiarcus sp.]|nr:hypothetical protein [Roseiarcus sp.]
MSLFAAGYVTITPKLNFEVSRRIKEEFENGRQYYELHGRAIAAPDDPRSVPDRAAPTWHSENRYWEGASSSPTSQIEMLSDICNPFKFLPKKVTEAF